MTIDFLQGQRFNLNKLDLGVHENRKMFAFITGVDEENIVDDGKRIWWEPSTRTAQLLMELNMIVEVDYDESLCSLEHFEGSLESCGQEWSVALIEGDYLRVDAKADGAFEELNHVDLKGFGPVDMVLTLIDTILQISGWETLSHPDGPHPDGSHRQIKITQAVQACISSTKK